MKTILLITYILFLSACASISPVGTCSKSNCKSAITSKKMKPGTTALGTVYALPKQLLEFKITRKKLTKEGLEKSKKKIEKSQKANGLALKKHQNETVSSLETKLNEPKISSVLGAKLELELEIAKLDELILKRKQIELQKNLDAVVDKIKKFKPGKLN